MLRDVLRVSKQGDSAATGPLALAGVLVGLYLAQGLPSGFFAHALPVLLRQQGVALEWIGLLKLLAAPWFFKCLWAPWVDRLGAGQAGHYRRWILAMQLASAGAVALLLYLPQGDWLDRHWPLLMLAVLLINTGLATQDIATDALAVKLLPLSWRGVGNAIQVSAYKLGMLAGGYGLLLLAANISLSESFHYMLLLLLALMLPLIWLREPAAPPAARGEVAKASLAMLWRGWLALPGIRLWLPVLLSYKLADALASAMIRPLMVDAGFSLERIGGIGMLSSLAGMLAAFAAGLAAHRLGGWRALFWAGLLQAVGLAAWALVPLGWQSDRAVLAIAVFEQIADAMSTVALFAAMMGFCRAGHGGADYSLQMSLFMLVSGSLSLGSGILAAWLGAPLFFFSCGALGLLCLLAVWRAAYLSDTGAA